MNRTQQKYLEERIEQIARLKRQVTYVTIPDPTKIIAARKLIKEYELKRMKAKQQILNAVEQYKTQLLDALYFQEEAAILLAIKSFEEKSF